MAKLSRRAVLATATAAAGTALAAPHIPAASAAEDKPLRLVVNVGLQNLDPVNSPSFVTRNFAYLVFDTLASLDSKGEIRPQMLEGWKVSPDNLTWDFTLRDGLKFHDGAPVTAEDCVASIKRWGTRDGFGRRLMDASKSLTATGEKTFTLQLARPFGPVMEALAKPSVYTPVIMPARIANATPSTQQVKEIVGSGPFVFEAANWVPGDRAKFHRNAAYVPRAEPPDGLAGGKVVRVERAELVTLTDPATRVAALRSGEIDYLEYAPFDYLGQFTKDPKLTLSKPSAIAQAMGAIAVNHRQPPFDNLLVRQALQQAINQSEIVAVHGLPPEMTQEWCQSVYLCGTPLASEAGTDNLRQPSAEKARALLKQAGYKNEPIVFLQAADSALINPMALVVIDQLKKAGFNVDIQTQDWATIAQRWLSNEAPNHGGWNLVSVIYTGFDMANPLSNPGIGYNCTGNAPWNYCDATLTPLLAEYEAEPDAGKRKTLAAKIQERALANANFPLTGQFASPAVWQSSLKGVVDFGFPVLWNISRA